MIFELSVAALMLAFLTSKKRKTKAPGGSGPGPYDLPDPNVVHPDQPTPGSPTGPSGPKPTPGSGPKPVTPTSPPPGSRIFGTPKGPSSGSIVTGNLGKWGNWIMVAKDCSWVIEGPYLWHLPNRPPSGSSAIEASTLAATLAIADGEGRGGNNITGFIDYLENEGYDDAQTAAQIVKEAAPMCAAVGPQFWSPQMRAWYQNLIGKISVWRQGIGFIEEIHAPVVAGKPNCADIYLYDDKLDEARAVAAQLREEKLSKVLSKIIEVTNPGCNPTDPNMRIHGKDKKTGNEWFRRGDFDDAVGNYTEADYQNASLAGKTALNAKVAAIIHPEGEAAGPKLRIDLDMLFSEGV